MRKIILVVDDDKTNLVIAKKALEEEYRVVCVPSGRSALHYLTENNCDLILLDVDMPVMDGIETLQEIRKKKNGMLVPVIFLTANKSKETVIEGAKLGIIDYITKPFDFEVLRSRVGGVLDKYDEPIQNEELYEQLEDILNDLKNDHSALAIPKVVEIMNRIK